MQPVSPTNQASLTVYFDGSCPVCSREIAYYQRQVGAEACVWVDVSSCPESELGGGLSRRSALGRFHVRVPQGELAHGMRGFAALWRALPRTAWLGHVASWGPMPALLDLAYGAFLVVRRVWHRPGSTWPRETLADLRSDRANSVLREALERCRLDEARHRDEALAAGPASGPMVRCWATLVSCGSAVMFALARRF